MEVAVTLSGGVEGRHVDGKNVGRFFVGSAMVVVVHSVEADMAGEIDEAADLGKVPNGGSAAWSMEGGSSWMLDPGWNALDEACGSESNSVNEEDVGGA